MATQTRSTIATLRAELEKLEIPGKGITAGKGIKYYKSKTQLLRRLKVLIGQITAGNNSKLVKNEIGTIADLLLEEKAIDREVYDGLYKTYVKTR